MKRYVSYFYDSDFYFFKEKLYNIEKDVEFIYNNSFKKIIDDLISNNLKPKEHYMKASNGDIAIFKSSQLKSKDCMKAHKANPVDICCGLYGQSSYGFGSEKEIIISLNQDIFNIFFANKYIPDGNSKLRRLKNEMTEDKIKASISHELAHWIDDSIYKLFNNILHGEKDPIKQRELLSFGTDILDTTYYEIQAQIHAIAQLKKKHSKEKWDSFTLNNLFEIYPPLADVIDKVYKKNNKELAVIWLKALLKRLNREKLLGTNMVKPLNINDLFKECLKSSIVL
jgi:hypothetical protein